MALVFTRNTVSGQLGWVPEEYLEHPWFKNQLVKADENEKNATPELFKSTDAEGQKAKDQSKADAKGSEAVE